MATAAPDILLLSLGTTLGWRHTDRLFAEQVRRAGASVEVVSVGFGLAGRLRRGYPVNDLVEMHAARRAARAALERHRPRALVVSSTTAAMLLPRLDVPHAVRLDAPARMNRPGARNALLHVLERRGLACATLTLPFSEAAVAELPAGAAPALVVSPPVEASGPLTSSATGWRSPTFPTPRRRDSTSSWPGGRRRLCPTRGSRCMGSTPASRELTCDVPACPSRTRSSCAEPSRPAEFRARMRAARVYAAGARWEDFGQAPLEALADGALVATVPSGGPFEALRIARRLEPGLVAAEVNASGLGRAIRAAFDLPEDRVRAYRERARELLAPLRPEAVQRTVGEEVLPRLLDRRLQSP